MVSDATHSESPPAAPWIDAFVMQMSRLGTRLPPAAVVARASQLWRTHWCDDPVQTALDEVYAKVRLTLSAEGASDQDLARGLAAAMGVLTAGGVSAQQALMAHWLHEGWKGLGAPETARPPDATLMAARLWVEAGEAAAKACGQGRSGQPPSGVTLGVEESVS
jgi:hypothetical protein